MRRDVYKVGLEIETSILHSNLVLMLALLMALVLVVWMKAHSLLASMLLPDYQPRPWEVA